MRDKLAREEFKRAHMKNLRNDDSDENTDEVMEIEKITRNSISDHVKFSMSESDGKKKRKKNEFD